MESKSNSNNKHIENNPSDYDRYDILKRELMNQGRIEDLDSIIELMNPPKDIKEICKNKFSGNIKVAIVGAGEAGLAAASELKKIGCNITIFEASKRVGGRAYTYYFDRLNKSYCEFGEKNLPISHNTTWHYINSLNLQTSKCKEYSSFYYLRDEGPYKKRKDIVSNIYTKYLLNNKDINLLKHKDLNKVIRKYLNSMTKEERRELLEIKESYSNKFLATDELSYKEIYKKQGLSEEGISLLSILNNDREYLGYALTEKLNKYYTLDEINQYEINGGMINLPLALYEALLHDDNIFYKNLEKDNLGIVNVRFSTLAEGIYDNKDKVRVKYKNIESNNEMEELFDFVIVAIPPISIRKIDFNKSISYEKIRAINEINFETKDSIYLYFKENLWDSLFKARKDYKGNIITDLPLGFISYKEEKNISYKGNKILLSASSTAKLARNIGNMNDDHKVMEILKYLERIYKLDNGYLNNKLLDYKSLNWKDVQFIYGYETINKPYDKTLYSYIISKAEMNNKLFLAGEYTSSKHGTQQGELQSGMIVANKVAEEINKKDIFNL